jgi:DNA processing protein
VTSFRELVLSGAKLPPRLRDLGEVPQAVYLRGQLPRGPAVALVGTRYPSDQGVAYARQLACELAAAGVCVLSGGAKGIDVAAHEGALVSGQTVVVAPSGWDRPYPPEHRDLYRKIVRSGGGHVSLVRRGPAQQGAFFARNEVLVALAHVVVVVEAPIRSGARNAAKHARHLGRPLFAVPAVPWNPAGLGCIAEIKLGALPLSSSSDLLSLLDRLKLHALPGAARQGPELEQALAGPPAWPVPPRKKKRGRKGRGSRSAGPVGCSQAPNLSLLSPDDPEAGRVLAAVKSGAVTSDELCDRLALPAPRVQQLLLTLTLDGVLAADATGRLTVLSV